MVYEQRADALKAKSQFNDVALDGQPMKIEMVESQGNERMLSSGIRYAVCFCMCMQIFLCWERSAPDAALLGSIVHTSGVIAPMPSRLKLVRKP